MAFNIVISEDPQFSTGIFKNTSLKIKASIKVLGYSYPKVLKEFQKIFSSLAELNKALEDIDPYENSRVNVYLELTAYTSSDTVEFVQIGETTLPLLQSADSNGFFTETYHGNPTFPDYHHEIEDVPLSGDLQLVLISKDRFEKILTDDYGADTPSISITEATLAINELTAAYNRLGAQLAAYKKQANQYIDFRAFDEITYQFSKKYFDHMNIIVSNIDDVLAVGADSSVISFQIDSKISKRYKAMLAAQSAIKELLNILDDQGFNKKE